MAQRVKAYSGSEPYAFVSYSHRDSHIVYPIIEQLHNMGYNIWYDQGIPLISDYGGELYRQIMGCSVFLLFESHHAGTSEDVAKEIHHALHFKKKIARIAIDENVQFPHDVAYHLLPTLQYLSINTEPGEFYAKLTETLVECKSSAPVSEPEEEKTPEVSAPQPKSVLSAPEEEPEAVVTAPEEKQQTPSTRPSVMRQPNNRGKFVAIVAAILTVVIGLVSSVLYDALTSISCGESNVGKVTDDSSSTTTDDQTTTEIDSLSVGDHFYFGSYEQDNVLSNGAEPIEWRVLEVKNDGSALLISEYALDCVPYNETCEDVTWEDCTLRKWLNNDFFNKAFSSDEQQRILEATLSNPDNPEYGTYGGSDTKDKVFCLSIDGAEKYFSSDNDRKCRPTDYAIAQGVNNYGGGLCLWWLRSPGFYSYVAADVNINGDIGGYGLYVHADRYGVRPVVLARLSD